MNPKINEIVIEGTTYVPKGSEQKREQIIETF